MKKKYTMKHLKLFEEYTKWYRGYTTTTQNRDYLWLTKNRDMAEVYSVINNASYGGDKIIGEYKVDLKGKKILDLSEYDTDERLEQYELEDFLEHINIKYDELEDLFDFTEDDIPLSRLINKSLDEIMLKYDGLKIKEFGKITLCIKRKFVKAIEK
jgi:hypothetical protein